MPCADQSKRQACVRTSLMRVKELDCDLQLNKKKKKKKPEFQLERFLWKARVKMYSARNYFIIIDSLIEELHLHCIFSFVRMLI